MQRIADLRHNTSKRLDEAANIRKRYLELFQVLDQQVMRQIETAEKLLDCHKLISQIRQEDTTKLDSTLNDFLPGDMKVTIKIERDADSENFRQLLQKTFGAQKKVAKNILKYIPECVTAPHFANMALTNDYTPLSNSLLERHPSDLESITEMIEHCSATLSWNERDEFAEAKIVRSVQTEESVLATLMQFQSCEWDDKVTIYLNGTPVNAVSPGQRSSAMLPLIALTSQTPLVIDQPEDNLDKKLIGETLQEILARLKEHRQIIVCTHDPNILVGGDAEQVIVLESLSNKKARLKLAASIDDDEIIETVMNTLEGGERAFSRRGKKYGLYPEK